MTPERQPFFNVQHSPIGAFASFTLGAKGASGGFGLELGKPADQSVFIGIEDRPGSGTFSCLPFYRDVVDESVRFEVEKSGGDEGIRLRPFPDAALSRSFGLGVDRWTAGDLSFVIHSPTAPAPDPARASRAEQKRAYVPALVAELEIDNRQGRAARRAFFGFQANDPARGMRRLAFRGNALQGIGCGGSVAVASDSPGVVAGQGFSPAQILAEHRPANRFFGIGDVGLLVATVPLGKRAAFRFALCFHRGGIVTTGLKARYHYARFFPDIEAVASYALRHFSSLRGRGTPLRRRLERARLDPERRFMVAQAVHSYYGSTQLLAAGRRLLWAVNEGEYRMLNTLDLAADHLFFELDLHPWAVGNVLDWYARRYAYVDAVRLPGDARLHPGGIAFSHDMGIANHFSPPGRSVYEKAGLRGCFSQMAHEELVNWAVCALAYGRKAGVAPWSRRRLPLFRKVLQSLLNRDHPDPARRDGIMSADAARCEGGGEITTYDSLDVSLGQARNNLYLAVKCWGVYVGLADLFDGAGDAARAETCRRQAGLAAGAVARSADAQGRIPAILHENVASRILPAVEGLVLPHVLGLGGALSEKGEYGPLILALKRHVRAVLKPGICLFPGGAWKLSSTSDNSWLSKIYLCQFVAGEILRCVPRAALR
ncbi:MAG TPA: glycoside hydrolase family 52 protein, partial [Candidatus Methylacidiphilales bacterium]